MRLLIPIAIFIHLSAQLCAIKDFLNEKQTYLQVLNYSTHNCSSEGKHYSKEVLAYVTDWNPKGKETSIKYANKITILSPVWYTLMYLDQTIVIQGSSDMDYINRLKEANPKIKIIPRISISQSATEQLISDRGSIPSVVQKIIKLFNKKKYDGMVLDIGESIKLQSVQSLLANLRQQYTGLIVTTLHPIFIDAFLDFSMANILNQNSDYINIMAYDLNQNAMNAPWHWALRSIESADKMGLSKHKMLLGIPFYGYIYGKQGSKVLMVEEYLRLVNKYSPSMGWNQYSEEHYIKLGSVDKFSDDSTIVFPTPRFVDLRINHTVELNLGGIGIWELGQGIDSLLGLF